MTSSLKPNENDTALRDIMANCSGRLCLGGSMQSSRCRGGLEEGQMHYAPCSTSPLGDSAPLMSSRGVNVVKTASVILKTASVTVNSTSDSEDSISDSEDSISDG